MRLGTKAAVAAGLVALLAAWPASGTETFDSVSHGSGGEGVEPGGTWSASASIRHDGTFAIRAAMTATAQDMDRASPHAAAVVQASKAFPLDPGTYEVAVTLSEVTSTATHWGNARSSVEFFVEPECPNLVCLANESQTGGSVVSSGGTQSVSGGAFTATRRFKVLRGDKIVMTVDVAALASTSDGTQILNSGMAVSYSRHGEGTAAGRARGVIGPITVTRVSD